MVRRLAVCVAFSTWCFFNTWVKLAQGGFLYFVRYDPTTAVMLPVLCWEVLLTLAMFLVWEYCGRLSGPRAQWIHRLFLLACAVPVGIGAVAVVALSPTNLGPLINSRLFWPVTGGLMVVPALLAFRRARAASHFMREVFLYSTPLLAVTLLIAARESLLPFSHADYADRPLAAPFTSTPSKTRVVWIIFDELSEAIAFANRPPGLELPNFDRLRAQSFYATAAESPASSTLDAIPSLLLGQQVHAVPHGPSELEIQWLGHPASAWSSLPNVFDSARRLGFDTALVGWYHPYGRILNHSLTRCYWTAAWLLPGVEEPSMPESFAASAWHRARLQSDALPLIHRFRGLPARKHQREQALEHLEYLRDSAIKLAADPSIGLVFIHLPVPHPPAVYNRVRQELTVDGARGYLDSVALADLTFAAIRRHMEETRVWDDTSILVSSDHSWRPSMWRDEREWNQEDETASPSNSVKIPFLLKLPGQTTPVRYQDRFNTVLSSRIVTAILAGELRASDEIVQLIRSWIEPRE
jgi:hypothetical protein